MTRTCSICGKEFTPACNRQRFCGKACYHKAKYARVGAYMRAQRLAARKDRRCVVCGAVFTPQNSLGKYCSSRCMRRARYLARHASKPRTCEVCGAEFTPANGRQRFCSARCRDRAKFRRPGVIGARPSRIVPAAPSLARVRAYLAMPPDKRWARRDTLTEEEHSLARRLYAEDHAGRCVTVNWGG